MREERLVEDRLRAEYVALLPEMKRIQVSMETKIRHRLLPIILELQQHEQIVIHARLKECESAVDSLRRRQEAGVFRAAQAESYSLTALPDLVGLRVMTFPGSRFHEVHRLVRPRIRGWVADPIPGIAHKYNGRWHQDDRIRSEIQIVPLLVSLFWEVEHSAIYKPTARARRAAESLPMIQRTAEVIAALQQFEAEFDRQFEASVQRP